MSLAAPPVQRVGAQTRVELLLTLRRGESVLVTIAIPALLLIFFGSAGSSGLGQSIDWLVPGILALAIMSTGMVSLGIATAFERYYRVLKRLGGTPLTRLDLLTAKVLSVVVIEAVQIVLLAGIAAVVYDWRPVGSLWLLLPGFILGTAAFAGIGLAMAGSLRAEATLAAANGLYLVLLLLGGMVLPLDLLPGALGAIASILPAAALSSTLRSALMAGVLPLPSLALLAGWAIVAIVVAARTFKWE